MTSKSGFAVVSFRIAARVEGAGEVRPLDDALACRHMRNPNGYTMTQCSGGLAECIKRAERAMMVKVIQAVRQAAKEVEERLRAIPLTADRLHETTIFWPSLIARFF